MSAQKIPATVITGFLGAGKTTLIRNLLENANGRRLALIINEFGDVGVDGEILKTCGNDSCSEDDIIELANGCICCTVAEDFIPTMNSLLGRDLPPEHIIIETSGLALPQPLVRAFNWPEIRSRVTVDGVLTVVDGKALSEGRFADNVTAQDDLRGADPSLAHDNPIEELFEDQLNCADLVLLNKTDLLAEAERDVLATRLRESLRAGAGLLPIAHGKADIDVVLGLRAGAEDDLSHRLSHHELEGESEHDHDDFESFVVTLARPVSREWLLSMVERVICEHGILRLKGFANISGSDTRLLVQAVGPRLHSYFDRPWKPGEERQTRLVLIGEAGIPRNAVEAAFKV